MTTSTSVENEPRLASPSDHAVVLDGEQLTIEQTVNVARRRAEVRLTEDEAILRRIDDAQRCIEEMVARKEALYGVTTGFGGMANLTIEPERASGLQVGCIRSLMAGAGRWLPEESVRAAMVVRANSHLRGASGLRLELIRRLERFLNARATPRVRELGSIGASGDLVPLAQIAGAVFGLDGGFQVDYRGETRGCREVLQELELPVLEPRPKEALAMVNGTSMMTGMAALCCADARTLTALALGAHALFFQALIGTMESFHPFIHRQKPHPGQIEAAELLSLLLEGSSLMRNETAGHHQHRGGEPIQDRYSLRCAPQYLGPILDGLVYVSRQVEREMNSANDNPLVDTEHQCCYHGGNFLGQYIGVGMDQLRQLLGLLAKHLDVQIAQLVAPEFNHGLPASLVGEPAGGTNMGLKGLQIAGNSIVPLITFLGSPLVDRFPTHAEQYNQNINSQGFGAASLARQSIDLLRQYTAIALIFGVQAVELRTYAMEGHYDARRTLSSGSLELYQAVHEVSGIPFSSSRAFIWDDSDPFVELHIAAIEADIRAEGRIPQAMSKVAERLSP